MNLRHSLLLFTALGALAPACLSRPLESVDPITHTTVELEVPQSRVDKIDILLTIDDSGSMADKQQILAVAVPNLVDALVNPPCLGEDGDVVIKPAGPLEACPAGTRRDFDPILDIHVGVISTSLGSKNGWSGCSDDGALLLTRIEDGEQPTYEDKGFLVWDPTVAPAPGRYADSAALNGDLQKMVRGVGDRGCGLEHSLESWYRFLIDPDPYAEIVQEGERRPNQLVGTDAALLAQRAEFLRPDSLVAIIMLSDENDCSFRAEGYGYYTAADANNGLSSVRARAVCADNPDDPCCTPCGDAPEHCPDDPSCSVPAGTPLPDDKRLINLTCFNQKQRFGVDLLYPTERYVKGLTQREIEDRHGNVRDNPLFVSPDGKLRSTDRVFLTGIVGVPWQLVARDESDLGQGYQTAAELRQNDTWAKILGDPAKRIPPSDPHMVESIHPRAGLPGPASAPGSDAINGHEYEVKIAKTDGYRPQGNLQYACTFELPTPIDCASAGGCDCNPLESSNNPLCQNGDGSYGTTQWRAKAYPGLRQLSVLEQIGDQAIVASICPAEVHDITAPDYGYLPAVEALVTRIKEQLRDPCLPRDLDPDGEGQVACLVLEARKLDAGESCSCDHAAGRSVVAPEHQGGIAKALESSDAQHAGIDCFCEIDQLDGEALDVCQSSLDDEPAVGSDPVHGWCYVDPLYGGGNEQLVSHCHPGKRRVLRFVGEGEPVNDSLVFITCNTSN